MKKQIEKIDPFKPTWVDQIHNNIWEAKKVFNNVLKGIRDEDELKEGRRQLERAYKLTNQVWDALREAMSEKTNCLKEFNNWKSENCAGVIMLLDEKLRKEYLPLFEAMIKEKKSA